MSYKYYRLLAILKLSDALLQLLLAGVIIWLLHYRGSFQGMLWMAAAQVLSSAAWGLHFRERCTAYPAGRFIRRAFGIALLLYLLLFNVGWFHNTGAGIAIGTFIFTGPVLACSYFIITWCEAFVYERRYRRQRPAPEA